MAELVACREMSEQLGSIDHRWMADAVLVRPFGLILRVDRVGGTSRNEGGKFPSQRSEMTMAGGSAEW